MASAAAAAHAENRLPLYTQTHSLTLHPCAVQTDRNQLTVETRHMNEVREEHKSEKHILAAERSLERWSCFSESHRCETKKKRPARAP